MPRSSARSGHIFQTKSDTEVIIHAYEQWGTACFERFNGQWALALWDARREQLLLSRDRLGIRPLYYSICRDKLLFASEMKAIFADPAVERRWDAAGLAQVFTFWCPVAPRTPFLGIHEICPGHFAELKSGKLTSKPYWAIEFPSAGSEQCQNETGNAEQLRRHLIEAARLRFVRSDVPVGAYLSGGIDSSVTSAIVKHYTEAPLRTFSIRFQDSEFDEGLYQRQMVSKLGAEHRDVVITSGDIARVFPEVIWHAEQPLLRTAPAPLYLLSKLVRDSGYKVVVTGEGADEMLAGYDIFREAIVRLFLARNPSSGIRHHILSRLYPWMERSPARTPAFARAFFGKSLDLADPAFSHRPRWDATASLFGLLAPEVRKQAENADVAGNLLSTVPPDFSNWDCLAKAQWLETVTLLSGYILSAQGDRMLMANSVEGRFPFLDYHLVEFANRLPSRHKLLGLDEKHLLKVAFSEVIPPDILKRPKQPYRAPDAASFFGADPPEWLNELTTEAHLKEVGLFTPAAVTSLMAKCRTVKGEGMSNTDNMRAVAVLSTLILHAQYIKGDGRGSSRENAGGAHEKNGRAGYTSTRSACWYRHLRTRSSVFRTLPDSFFGKVLQISMYFGILKAASLPARCWFMACRVSWRSCFNTTKALMASPNTSSSTPITATSWIPSISRSTSSISLALTRKPLTLMMSFFLPTT